jgi:hypothetical protein
MTKKMRGAVKEDEGVVFGGRKILLDIDFGMDRKKNPETVSNQQISVNLIHQAVQNGYKEGLNSDKRRIWNRVLAALQQAVKANKKDITFNEYEFSFLKEAFGKAVVPAGEIKLFCLVEEQFMVDSK